jgi:hypothetical protein
MEYILEKQLNAGQNHAIFALQDRYDGLVDNCEVQLLVADVIQ